MIERIMLGRKALLLVNDEELLMLGDPVDLIKYLIDQCFTSVDQTAELIDLMNSTLEYLEER